MWYIHFILKPLFGALLLFVLLPYFSRKKNVPYFIGLLLLQFTIFLGVENLIVNSGNDMLHEHSGTSAFTWLSFLGYLLITAICFAIFFTREWVRNEKQKRILIETQLNSELNYLKSQINPHFLFNTLNNLFSIAQKHNVGELEYGISRLAGLMRYMLYDSNVNLVVLSKEVNNIKDYIGVCQLRYPKDEVQVNFVEKGNSEQAYIAPMILIPFIENAFKHGINIENKSLIDISIEATDKKIIFNCSNYIFQKEAVFRTNAGGIGLENVKRRLHLLYPQKHELTIKDERKKYHVHLNLTTS